MNIAYFDCFAGAAGDMIVGACLDAGAPSDKLFEELAKLKLDEVELHAEKVSRKGIAATSFAPKLTNQKPTVRNLSDITKIITNSQLTESVKTKAVKIFENLAAAEAKVHGITCDKIHFHEVGAADAIMDIVGACVGLELLGIEKIYCSDLIVGHGTIQCAHGTLPVPAPATAELIKGINLKQSNIEAELLTPTGAAILTTLSRQFGPLPAMQIESVGYGAGQRESSELPNVLRLMVGQATRDQPEKKGLDQVCVLEANIDDAGGELIGYVTEQLRHAGALDVYYTAISMKKNRPGTQLSVICHPDQVKLLEGILFEESTTLGVRRHLCQRT
ncbi:MAG: nickel pincer cofactor biosynthesis protein LarC, partial [Planctomycetes bacterium]|nr:nickel pincer cofactor biosynthesis protein LarC [Planctomycetota bacterium]